MTITRGLLTFSEQRQELECPAECQATMNHAVQKVHSTLSEKGHRKNSHRTMNEKSAQRKYSIRKGSTHWAFILMSYDPYYLPSDE